MLQAVRGGRRLGDARRRSKLEGRHLRPQCLQLGGETRGRQPRLLALRSVRVPPATPHRDTHAPHPCGRPAAAAAAAGAGNGVGRGRVTSGHTSSMAYCLVRMRRMQRMRLLLRRHPALQP